MFDSDARSAIERLKKGLYSRTDRFGESPRHPIENHAGSVESEWKARVPEPVNAPHPMRPWYRRGVFIGLGLFILALIVTGYTLIGGRTFVSVDNIDITIEGPANISGGEVFELMVTVNNGNATDMQLADLIVEFPSGAKDPNDPSRDLVRERISVGDIGSGDSAKKQIRAILYGKSGSKQSIGFTIEYRTPGSNAIFFKEKEYIISISSSPVTITIDAPTSATPGSVVETRIGITSNTTSVIKNVLLTLEYPFGWSFVSSSPQPIDGDSVWSVGDLSPGSKRTIVVRGTVDGQDGEERTVHATVGMALDGDDKKIGTAIISGLHTVTLTRPALGLAVSINGNASDVAVESGRLVRADIIWTNNTPDKIVNGRIEAKLSGMALDRTSVSVDGDGYYDSSANTVIWDSGRLSDLREIRPGESGRASVSFQSLRNPSFGGNVGIVVDVTASGSRVGDTGGTELITTSLSRSAKLVSNLAISARTLRSQGPISNIGPIPPRADSETTYTIVWTLTNTSNTISRIQVRSKLPPGVRWTGVSSPEDALLSYDEASGDIVWNAGTMRGGQNTSKEVAFQVAITPNVSQVGSVPQLMGQSFLTAFDEFAGVTIETSAPAQTTRATTDIFWKSGDETVVQ